MSSSYKCVQLNCDFSSAGSSLLEKYAASCKMDIIFVQDIYSSNLFYSAKSNQIPKAAIYISKSIQASMVSHASNANCVTCKLSSNRVSGSSTGTASPIQIDGRENCVTEI